LPITPVYRKLESDSWLERCGVEPTFRTEALIVVNFYR
jgi:hypothetical protein